MTAPPAAIQPESLPRLVGEGIALAASAQGPVLTVAPERLHQVCAHLREEPDCCFDFLADFIAGRADARAEGSKQAGRF